MFTTTVKAKINAYKWIIVICLFGLLTLGLGWQYHRATTLEMATKALTEDNTELKGQITFITTEFRTYKANTNKALADIDKLRDIISTINDETASLENRLQHLGNISKPVANGSNSADIEKEVNALSDDVFERIENASRGKTTNEK